MQGKEHKIKTLETLHAHSLLCELEYNTSVGFFTPMQNKLKWFEGDTYGSLSIKESHFLNPHTCWVVCLSQWSDSNWELNSQGLPDATMDNSWIPWRVRCKASVLHWLGKDTSWISFLPVEPFSHRGLLSNLGIFTLTSLSQRTGSDKVAAWISSLRNGEGSCSAGWMETSLKAWPEIVGDRKKISPWRAPPSAAYVVLVKWEAFGVLKLVPWNVHPNLSRWVFFFASLNTYILISLSI